MNVNFVVHFLSEHSPTEDHGDHNKDKSHSKEHQHDDFPEEPEHSAVEEPVFASEFHEISVVLTQFNANANLSDVRWLLKIVDR